MPAFGHTPGSVIVFVTLPSGTRYASVGDLVYQLEGITQREERPWLVRRKADRNAEGTRENLLRMIELKERLPQLIIVPAHDMRGFEKLPPLYQASNQSNRNLKLHFAISYRHFVAQASSRLRRQDGGATKSHHGRSEIVHFECGTANPGCRLWRVPQGMHRQECLCH